MFLVMDLCYEKKTLITFFLYSNIKPPNFKQSEEAHSFPSPPSSDSPRFKKLYEFSFFFYGFFFCCLLLVLCSMYFKIYFLRRYDKKKRSNIDIKQIKTRNLHRLELNEYFSCLWSRSMCIRVVSSGEGYLQ